MDYRWSEQRIIVWVGEREHCHRDEICLFSLASYFQILRVLRFLLDI